MSILDILPIIITASGVILLFKLRFFFILHPLRIAREIGRRIKSTAAFRSLSLALAGTLGVGNIVGVAYGISVGGAGSLFWLLISGIFASVIKYAECTLAADKSYLRPVGMAAVIEASFPSAGRFLGIVYSILTILLSLSMGSALQSNSATQSGSAALGIKPLLLSVLFALFVAIIIARGAAKIEKVTAIIIPIATLVYIIISLCVIFSRLEGIPAVVSAVIDGAFRIESAVGGVSSFLFSKTIKEGYARGILSNEAGAGTSCAAQTRSDSASAASVGLFGILEVFFDTVLLCTLSGVVILLEIPEPSIYKDGISLVIAAFSGILGSLSPVIIFLLMLAFAYSTVVCWYYYGMMACSYLFKKNSRIIYTAVFILATFLGGILSVSSLILFADYILLFMCAISLSTVLKSSERIVFLSEQYGLIGSKNSYIGKGSVACSRNRGKR